MNFICLHQMTRLAEIAVISQILLDVLDEFYNITHVFISRPARWREIIICTMCVRACVRAWVHACVRACVTQFPLKLLQLHIFGKLVVLMNFFCSSIFFGFGELWPTCK